MKTTAKTKNSIQKQTKSNGSKPKHNVSHALRGLFIDELKDIYWAEKALTKSLPKMIKNATSKDLEDALNRHFEITKQQVIRLEEVFASIDEKPAAKKCEAMVGLIKEAEQIMRETEEGVVRDAGIILAGQKIEHYEIATYGTLCAFANALNEDEAAGLLEETLIEEKDADETLSGIAESSINIEAIDEFAEDNTMAALNQDND
ncbi:MAG TPA: ferritin-like domain-containing protein [Bacteroidia bacterium]|jgi:ferritin-like metal-binding protein YciE|nr:ferritin-like domain-containing protein [Bacteroidia bacterium]